MKGMLGHLKSTEKLRGKAPEKKEVSENESSYTLVSFILPPCGFAVWNCWEGSPTKCRRSFPKTGRDIPMITNPEFQNSKASTWVKHQLRVREIGDLKEDNCN